jgi:hypothetical protein
MLVCLGTIQDNFDFRENGAVAFLPLPSETLEWSVKPGDIVVVRRPDGSEIKAKVTGTDLPRTKAPSLAILFRELGKGDLPIGAEIWVNGGAP